MPHKDEESLASKPDWKAKLRKAWRWIRVGLLIVGPVSALTVWMAFQHKPAWYAPAHLDEAEQQRARRNATRRADEFGDALVRRVPFVVTILEAEVNSWLAATPSLWPRSEGAELRDPAVRFEPGLVRVGVLIDRGGWLVILSAGIECALSSDSATVGIQMVQMRAGSLPIPRGAIAWSQQAALESGSGDAEAAPSESLFPDVQSVDDLLSGVDHRNWFVWPNGNRAFSIESISVESGLIHLGIRPH